MKKTFILIATAVTLIVLSCTKPESEKEETVTTVTLKSTVAAGTAINKGSTVTLSLGTDASKTVTWTSKPDTGLTISASGNAASVQFKSSGTYTITGTYGPLTGSNTYTVKDTGAATPPSSYKDLAFSSNEELVLTAKKLGDTVANGGIQIGGYTTLSYPCGSWTRFTQQVSGTTLTINFTGLLEALVPCNTGTSVVYVGGGGITSMAAGATYQLVINFNGQTYTGSIAKSAAGKFTITWPYTTGVKISPLSF